MGTQKTVGEFGEFALIRRISEILGLNSKEVIVGLGDDAAVVNLPNRPLVITTDTMIETVHFRREWGSASELAVKSLASNMSDLAAKCAEPAYCLVTLGLSPETPIAWVEEFYQTLARLRSEWGVEVIGGDTVRSSQLLISITALGYQIPLHPIENRTARIGDRILVTGTVGDAAAGLEILQNRAPKESVSDVDTFLIRRFQQPTPRFREAMRMIETTTPTSMTDISDGLARDLPKLCHASGVGARIHPQRLPCSLALKDYARERAALYAWKGGEDYELLFTLPPSETDRLIGCWDDPHCPLTVIGEITSPASGIVLTDWNEPSIEGFDHFRS
ncbi:MAG: thiamine-phosphate kinase [Candidatus Omnitrophota bacterium]|jgi:thiamine-monophosphate kinase|nr:MAG: thiamine-phosphate kinase [Candidatus Omnitrophota bacterium]